MNREQYLFLFEKFLAGKATPEEVEKIMSYRDKFELMELTTAETPEDYKEIEDRLLKRIKSDIDYKQASRFGYSKLWMAAAAVLILTIGSLFYVAYRKNEPVRSYSKNLIKTNNINPGSTKALLTLANGEKIDLNDATAGDIIKQGNIKVQKKKEGVLQYVSTPDIKAAKNEIIAYNTVSTPRGGQYQVILPDGTKVWLNSASSLKFPTAFTGNERKVELTGEGYFEVAKNKDKPFKVNFNQQEVEVLGTHFNIMAYDDESESKTTLLEGSIKISKGGVKRILIPGQQAVNQNNQNYFTIEHADIEKEIAWKDGFFSFQNTNIRQIMRQIARWYDVDVSYQGNLQDKEYGGRVAKSKDISEILKNLELTGTIHFKVEGRRVIVME